ncbi:hypothetical protein F5Y06DRAFT_295307 [Hypoxylon sp. FL0890]|nr:hypothetical protein F5Y06DRAFT_295307 [Hypoxylon sp. FL0890]
MAFTVPYGSGHAPNSSFLTHMYDISDIDIHWVSPDMDRDERWGSCLGKRRKAVADGTGTSDNNEPTASPQPISSPQPTTSPQLQHQPQQPEDDDLTCTQCNKVLKTKATLRQHIKDVHIGTQCFWPGCAASFSSKGELNAHLKEHNGVTPPDQRPTCHWPGCGKTYEYPQTLARHLREHNIQERARVEN